MSGNSKMSRVDLNGVIYEVTPEVARQLLQRGSIRPHPRRGEGWYEWTMLQAGGALERVGTRVNG
jgi:hypothetical protein